MEEKIYTGIDKSLDEMAEFELIDLRTDYMEMINMIDEAIAKKKHEYYINVLEEEMKKSKNIDIND